MAIKNKRRTEREDIDRLTSYIKKIADGKDPRTWRTANIWKSGVSVHPGVRMMAAGAAGSAELSCKSACLSSRDYNHYIISAPTASGTLPCCPDTHAAARTLSWHPNAQISPRRAGGQPTANCGSSLINLDGQNASPILSYRYWPNIVLPVISIVLAPAGNSMVSVRAYGDTDSAMSTSLSSIKTTKAASPKVSRTNCLMPCGTR